jgi:hypothetical protein
MESYKSDQYQWKKTERSQIVFRMLRYRLKVMR